MTALANLSTLEVASRPPVAPLPSRPGAVFIDLPTASARSALSIRHLRRLCAAWQNQGLAMLRRPDSGGRAEWYVAENADDRFARVKFGNAIAWDARRITEAHRGVVIERRQLLDRFSNYLRTALASGIDRLKAADEFARLLSLAEGRQISARTLLRWEKAFSRNGLAGLEDRRRSPAPKPAKDDPFLKEFARLYMLPRLIPMSLCYQLAMQRAEGEGWKTYSDTTCRRYLQTMQKAGLILRREGEDHFVATAEPFIERDYSTLRSNELLCVDHHQMDVLVNAGTLLAPRLARPWLTAWQDLRSRKIVGWIIRAADPNTEAILASFRAAVLAFGVPEKVYLDNGRDMDSYALNGRTKADRWARRKVRLELSPHALGVFGGLGIEVIHAWPYHGQSKPIERFFGTAELPNRTWPTYCGRSTAHKPHDLQLQIERGNAPLLADYVAWFGDWLEKRYHADIHTGDAMNDSPNNVYAANLAAKRTTSAELLDTLLLAPTKPLKVGRNGVTYKGLRYGQYELCAHLGREVTLRVDDRDLSRVQVWTPDGKFLCLANANRKLPFNATAQELREAINEKKRVRKLVREAHQHRPRLTEDLPDMILMARADRCRAEAQAAVAAATPATSIKPVRSDLEDQLPKLQRAMQSKAPERHDDYAQERREFVSLMLESSNRRAVNEYIDKGIEPEIGRLHDLFRQVLKERVAAGTVHPEHVRNYEMWGYLKPELEAACG